MRVVFSIYDMPKRSRQFAPTHTKARRLRIAAVVVVIIAIFAVPVIRTSLRHGVSAFGLSITKGANSIGGWFGSIGTAVRTKHSLEAENIQLKAKVDELTAQLAERDQLARDNAELRVAMGRKEIHHFTLAAVIAKPPHSIYDTLIIDGGASLGFVEGDIVYADGETPIGTIGRVMPNSAIVRLYSSPGERTEARLSPSNVDITLVGRGGGNFSATVPHDVTVAEGAAVITKEIDGSIIGVFKKITSDERDPFKTLLLVSPTNINELAYVQVRQK